MAKHLTDMLLSKNPIDAMVLKLCRLSWRRRSARKIGRSLVNPESVLVTRKLLIDDQRELQQQLNQIVRGTNTP